MNILTPQQWKKSKAKIDFVFNQLENLGVIVLADTGTTQEDAFADCSQVYNAKPAESICIGFCFYSHQDKKRAKTSGMLPLSFWGAPDGNEQAMNNIGQLIQSTFTNAGFIIQWNGDSGTRPLLILA